MHYNRNGSLTKPCGMSRTRRVDNAARLSFSLPALYVRFAEPPLENQRRAGAAEQHLFGRKAEKPTPTQLPQPSD